MAIENRTIEGIEAELKRIKHSGPILPWAITNQYMVDLTDAIETRYKYRPLPILTFLSGASGYMQEPLTTYMRLPESAILHIGLERQPGPEAETDPLGFEVGQLPNPEQVEGENLLLVDVGSRTGNKLRFAEELMYNLGAETVSSCVLVDTTGKDPDVYHPDIVAMQSWTGIYYTFPWEWEEIINLTHARNQLREQFNP